MSSHVMFYIMCQVMLYNIYYVKCCYVIQHILCKMLLLYNIKYVMSLRDITYVMLCYITCVISCYITYAM